MQLRTLNQTIPSLYLDNLKSVVNTHHQLGFVHKSVKCSPFLGRHWVVKCWSEFNAGLGTTSVHQLLTYLVWWSEMISMPSDPTNTLCNLLNVASFLCPCLTPLSDMYFTIVTSSSSAYTCKMTHKKKEKEHITNSYITEKSRKPIKGCS